MLKVFFRKFHCVGLWLAILFLLAGSHARAQQPVVSGYVTDSLGQPVELVNIVVQQLRRGTTTNSQGFYRLELPAGLAHNITFSHSEFMPRQREVRLGAGENLRLDVRLQPKTTYLQGVEISSGLEESVRGQAGALRVDPKDLQQVPTPFMDFNQALVSGGALGIVGNNELSSAYQVRGGNFDENLVYVENIQVYRPFLVRAGEQEGLSFINPDMVGGVEFSSGGWQPKYGDKLSSVLNVTYRQPARSGGSLTLGLLGGSLHAEGTSTNKKFRFSAGARHKSSRYLLGTLETDGEYLPRFTDVQSWLTWDLSGKNRQPGTTTLGLLTSYARNRYSLEPESRTTTFGTFNQVFRLNVLFTGNEELSYDTFQGGLKLSHFFSDSFRSDFILSAMGTREREFINVEGGYRLCDVNTSFGTPDFNECVLVRGFGSEFRYGRNLLNARIFSAESRNEWEINTRWRMDFGLRLDLEKVEDELYEYTFLDSADFVQSTDLLLSSNVIESQRLSGYWQTGLEIAGNQQLTAGVRFQYWSLNNDVVFSPRLQYSIAPYWNKDIVFRLAAGYYRQPPFYREMRDFEGGLNTDLRAQSSLHLIAGMDWNLLFWGRPFKFIMEGYYKDLWDVVAYDLDNVRLRYYATNDTRAQVVGADFRLSGEFIPGTQSWFNLSLLSAREDVTFDERGDIRRPSDQRVTFSFFFEDHLPNDPSIRVNIRTLFGSGLPYGPPNSPQFRQALSSASRYVRSDIGFSKIFSIKRQSGKRSLESVWVGLEVLNLFGVDNNISFTWVPDFSGLQFAVPNSLSQRFFNLRTVLRY